MAWCCVALLAIGGVMALIQPFRPGLGGQLISVPRFAFEALLGLLVCAGISRAAFAIGIPDVRSQWRRARAALMLLALWLALFALAVIAPVLEPSMADKRPLCHLEILIYAAPLTIVGLLLMRRLLPLEPAKAGAWMGFAAGLIPAYLMQLACMHEPWHNLTWHLLPTLGAAGVGSLLGYWLLRRR